MSPTGITFTFQHNGRVEGIVAGLPFGTPECDSRFEVIGNNPAISREFDGLVGGAVFRSSIDEPDELLQDLKQAIEDIANAAAQQLGKAAAAAVIALVV